MRTERAASRVVVTGLGSVTAAGTGVAALWNAVLAGRSLAEWRATERVDGPREAVCRSPELAMDAPELRKLKRMDRSVQLAGVAAREAWQDAGLGSSPPAPERTAIFVGSSRGPVNVVLDSHATFVASKHVRPSVAPASTFCCVSGALSNVFEARGPCFTISVACASGAAAIALAAQQILAGAIDIALAGGAEAPLHDLLLAQLRSARVLASHPNPQQACRPFDAARTGTVLGEGAAFLVLESLAAAKRRGAPIRAELAGWAIGSEGDERTGISDDNAALDRCMRDALRMARVSTADVGYVNAHGTGTKLNDRMEAQAIKRLGGGHRLATSSTKPVTGHCMGAASAVEAVISISALENQCLPPNANCEQLAEDCPIDLVLNQPRVVPIRAALTNSVGFWGNNASLVLKSAP